MKENIRQLEPNEVWNKFADLNAIPRPSKKEERVIKFMLDFGKRLKLETFKDNVGNVIIRKPPSKGMEDRKTITLQSHLDMVHQKNNDTQFDFNTQGIEMEVDGDWVKAKGTTLGADNGLGVASIMALLESKHIVHPPLEALFTVDEETGMTGAMGLESGVLKGTILLNLDTEEDDELDIGCAGGIDVTATGSYAEEPVPSEMKAFSIKLKGLKGGHSGIEIHKGLGNANKIMNRLLYKASSRHGIRISNIEGGGLRNAIPRESSAIIVLDKARIDDFSKDIEGWAREIALELAIVEPDLFVGTASTTLPDKMMGHKAQEQFLKSVYAAYNGVYAMSAAIPELVETSNNVARVEVIKGKIKIGCLTRSAVNSAKEDLSNALRSAFELAGYTVSYSGDYPGWAPNPHSPLLKLLEDTYEKLFNLKPKVAACHAGLECGILGRNYPEMDMISFGPTIKGAHSPDEKVQISSVQKFWKFLLEILSAAPKK